MSTERIPTEIEMQLDQQASRAESILSELALTQSEIPVRRYKGKEIEERLKTPLASIYNDEERKKLPFTMERDDIHRRKGYTQEQVNELQSHYNCSPRRLDTEQPVILSFTNFKGGCWKSTTSFYASSYYASLGYRVLLVDLDPQATLTTSLGFLPDIDLHAEDSLLNFICSEDGEGFDDDDVGRIVKDTHVSNLKLIPSVLDLDDCNVWLTVQTHEANRINDNDDKIWLLTRVRSLLDKVSGDFDIVIIDGTPSLGFLSTNIILAADEVIVPVPTEITDFASTSRFCRKLQQRFKSIADGIGNETASRLFPRMSYMPTRYSQGRTMTLGSEEVLACIQDTFLDHCLESYIRKHDSVISNLTLVRKTIFDVNAGAIKTSVGDINIKSDTRKKAMANFGDVFDEIIERCVRPYWPSQKTPNVKNEEEVA